MALSNDEWINGILGKKIEDLQCEANKDAEDEKEAEEVKTLIAPREVETQDDVVICEKEQRY